MITGLRGSGKTVLMTRIEKRLRENSDWIVVDVNPEQNVMEEIVAYLSNWHSLVQDASVSLSAMGIGVNMKQRTTDGVVLDISASAMRRLIRRFFLNLTVFFRSMYTIKFGANCLKKIEWLLAELQKKA